MPERLPSDDVKEIANGTFGSSLRTNAEKGLTGISLGAIVGLIAGAALRQNALITAGIGAAIGYIVSRTAKNN